MSIAQEERQKKVTYHLIYHFVWVTKRKKKVLVGEVVPFLKEKFEQSAESIEVTILEKSINDNNVYLRVNAHPRLAPYQIVNEFKTFSAPLLVKRFDSFKRLPSVWTRSYLVSTEDFFSMEKAQQFIDL